MAETNIRDRRSPHIERLCKIAIALPCGATMANLNDGGRGESCEMVGLSIGRPANSLPTFSDHIGGVVSGCAEEQVIRVDTATDVAAMKHIESVRDRATVKFPSDARRARATNVASDSADRDLSVPAGIASTCPEPTTGIRFW
jgi:hypothetical protein